MHWCHVGVLDAIAYATELDDVGAFERSVLSALQRAVGFDVAFFVALGSTPTTIGLDVSQVTRALSEQRYEHELMPVKQAALRARGVAVDTRVLGEHRVRGCAYFREFAAPIGGRHSLLAWMVLRGRPLGALLLGRCGTSWSDAQVSTVEAALPGITLGRASYRSAWRGEGLSTLAASASTRALGWLRRERTVATVTNREGVQIKVRDRNGYREMIARQHGAELIWSSAEIRDPRRSAWFYVDLFHLAAARASARERVLFIGCGGAVALRQFAEVYPGIAIDVVDVDASVIDLAYDHYGMGAIPGLTTHVLDGLTFLAQARAARWDVVIVDAYDTELAQSFCSRRLLRDIRRVLRPGGQMAFNVIGTLAGASAVQEVERAASAALSDVRLVPVLDPGEDYAADALRNVVVLGGRPCA